MDNVRKPSNSVSSLETWYFFVYKEGRHVANVQNIHLFNTGFHLQSAQLLPSSGFKKSNFIMIEFW
jgi:hypothetical protein